MNLQEETGFIVQGMLKSESQLTTNKVLAWMPGLLEKTG